MEWKIITGQICLTAVIIACVVQNINHGILYAGMGALAASVGYPFLKKESET